MTSEKYLTSLFQNKINNNIHVNNDTDDGVFRSLSFKQFDRFFVCHYFTTIKSLSHLLIKCRINVVISITTGVVVVVIVVIVIVVIGIVSWTLIIVIVVIEWVHSARIISIIISNQQQSLM